MLSQTTYGSEQLFYYSFDKKVLIEEVPGKFMIKKKSDISQAEMETIIRLYVDEPTISWFNSDICTVSVEDILVEQTITHLIQEESVLSARHIYNTSTGKHYYEGRKNHRALDIGLIDQLVLKYKEGVSLTVKDNLNNTYGLTKYKQNELFGLYTISKKSDILSISNILFETGYFEYVYPELICKYTLFEERTFYPNDTYFQYQVTLHNTGQSFNGHYGTADADIDAPEAWAVTMGNEDIVIAVIDQGVTSNHPDLPNTRQVRLNGSNTYDPANFSFSYSQSSSDRSNSTIEYDHNENWKASADYSYSPGLKGWSPFENIPYDARWFRIIKETKINFLPQSFSFNTDLQRSYHELQERDLEGSEGIPVTFSQQFYWNRSLSLRWDPLQLIRLSFNASTRAEVEEPYTVVNKDLYPDEYELWKDSVKMSLRNMGRPLDYSQSFNASYAIPLNKLPALDWITADASFNSSYSWNRGTTYANGTSYGNIISNRRSINLSGRFNLLNMYNKVTYLHRINNKYQRIGRNKVRIQPQ